MVANLASAANATLTGASTTASTTAAAGTYQGAGTTVASQSATSQTQLAGNFDTFLKLLTAQLQHQDPLSPMDTSQFTNQLVQYSAVEQQININANLEKMLAGQNSNEMASAVGYLGQEVQGVSTSLPLQNGNSGFAYTTPANTGKVSIVISDQSGSVVKTIAGDATAGTHQATWDGTDSYGTKLADGTYSINISSTGSDGTQTPMDAAVSGIVTSVGMDSSNNVQLYMGGVNLPLSKVIEVQLPSSTPSTSSGSGTSTGSGSGTSTGSGSGTSTTSPGTTAAANAVSAINSTVNNAANNAVTGLTGTTTN